MIKECKKCGSENLYLEPRVKGQDVLTANMVALKCKDCGNWLKWCPKDERQFYINKKQDNKVEQCWVIQRDDGKYVNFMDNEDLTWYEHTWQATMTWSKHQAEKDIVLWKLQNCRPVKVEIRVVGE